MLDFPSRRAVLPYSLGALLSNVPHLAFYLAEVRQHSEGLVSKLCSSCGQRGHATHLED